MLNMCRQPGIWSRPVLRMYVCVCMYVYMYVCSPVAIPTELYEADIIGLFEANINDLMVSLTLCSLSQDQK